MSTNPYADRFYEHVKKMLCRYCKKPIGEFPCYYYAGVEDEAAHFDCVPEINIPTCPPINCRCSFTPIGGGEQKTEKEYKRQETGPLKIGDDWTGYFLRGDDAFSLALSIEGHIKGEKIREIELLSWAKQLKECEEKSTDTEEEKGE